MAGKKKRGPVRSNAPVEKDDGTRWIVIDPQTERPLYPGAKGVLKREAERLASGLIHPATIKQIK